MAATLDKLLHSLANHMQTASAGATLLSLSGSVSDESTAKRLQALMNELQAAATIVQAMQREYEAAESKKKSAAG